jgi:hypothetical protein
VNDNIKVPVFDLLKDQMTSDQAKCYLGRYQDSKDALKKYDSLNSESKATNHYKDFGKKEGRVTTCAPRITPQ